MTTKTVIITPVSKDNVISQHSIVARKSWLTQAIEQTWDVARNFFALIGFIAVLSWILL